MKSTTLDLADFQSQMEQFVDAAEATGTFLGFVETAESDGALDAKTKELISLAIGAAVHCDPCILWHGDACVKAGATDEEIAEALQVAVVMGGGPAMAYATKAWSTVRHLREESAPTA